MTSFNWKDLRTDIIAISAMVFFGTTTVCWFEMNVLKRGQAATNVDYVVCGTPPVEVNVYTYTNPFIYAKETEVLDTEA